VKTIYEIAHIKLCLTNDNLLELHIEDTEVFDTFDDVLIEKFNIENYYCVTELKSKKPHYILCFQKDIDIEKVITAVKSISENEVIRIYKLNNESA
jgi:hypothetical protein